MDIIIIDNYSKKGMSMKLLPFIKTPLIFLYILSEGFVFSQESKWVNYHNNPESVIIFEDKNRITINIDYPDTDRTEKQGVYSTSIKHGVTFINVTWEDNTADIFLMLSNNTVCYLYKAEDTNPYLLGFYGGYNRVQFIYHIPKNIRATSSLFENRVTYSPDKINGRLGQAWAEGVKGQGIHEKLFINPPNTIGITAIHISIGFVSYEKPYLYEENSRPKKINVSVENKFSFTADLEDTPNFQTIKFPQPIGENDVLVLEILDVYPGTKYEDTCINNIIYDTYPLGSYL
jgi:hypothetical protein